MTRTTIREEDITSGAVPTTGIVGVTYYTSSTTWNKSARESALGVTLKKVIVEVQGAGGSGARHSVSSCGSSGSGGYAKKLIDVSGISSATITVGSGGAEAAINTAGNDGGASSWADGTNTVTGPGGLGGYLSSSAQDNQGVIGTGGDINLYGYRRGRIANAYYTGGNIFPGAGLERAGVQTRSYGGGTLYGDSNASTGSGGDGIIIVTEIAG